METNQFAEYVKGTTVIFESLRLSVGNFRKYSVDFKGLSLLWMFSNLDGSGDLSLSLITVCCQYIFITFKLSYIITDNFIFITFTADIISSVAIWGR